MKSSFSPKYSGTQLTFLTILRVLIGWHFLYEGLTKLTNPDWSSFGFLMDSKWIFAGFFESLTLNQGILHVVDFLNVWGLILIGLALILGILTRPALISGIVLLGFYYLSHPPLIGITYAIPSEGTYLWVNKNLIELFALAVLYVFPSERITGIDQWLFSRTKNKQQ